jgi:hypothetical protein
MSQSRCLSREEAWELQYRIRPYLEVATSEQLRSRCVDVIRNLYTLTPEGKVGALAPDKGGLLWCQKLWDVRHENLRRDQDFMESVAPEDFWFDDQALELVRRNQSLSRHATRTGLFCKFGESKWMRALFEEGEILLSPASYYRGIEKDVARQDDELVISTIVSPYDHDLGFVDDWLRKVVPPRSWAVVRHEKPSDHYLYCVTVGFDFRFFIDFGGQAGHAESALLIWKQDEFERRLVSAVRRELPQWHVSFGMARYVDPYCVIKALPNVGDEIFYFKNFRFMYQREHRLVAEPPAELSRPLERIRLTLGPLKDIAELVEITGVDAVECSRSDGEAG